MKLPFENLNRRVSSPEELRQMQKEVRGLWEEGWFILREVSPPQMFGCALYSVDSHILNRYDSYNDPNICLANATWTKASLRVPTLTNYLKSLPVEFTRVNLWNTRKGYEQPWHTDPASRILHFCIQRAIPQELGGVQWNINGQILHDPFEEGEAYFIDPQVLHQAFNRSEVDRYNIIAFVSK